MENNQTGVALDPERQKKAREYARIRRRMMVLELACNGVYAMVWILSGWSISLRDWLLQYTRSDWLVVAGFVAVYGGIDVLISLPLAYYGGFILPHRYGQSLQSLKEWILDGLKGLLISVPLGLLLIEAIYVILRSFPDTWWLWAAGLLLVVNVVVANLFPVLVAPLFNKYVPLGAEYAELEARLLGLAHRVGTKVRGVYKFDMSRRTRAANAALVGLGNTRRIILGDTLLNEFTSDEIETVMAHELAHQVHRDLPLGILVSSAVTLVGLFLASIALREAISILGYQSVADVAALPLFSIVMGAYSLVTMPLLNGFSRWREGMADGYSLCMTGKNLAFASAMTRLANQNLAEVDPEAWVEFLLYSHPALGKRIAKANEQREIK